MDIADYRVREIVLEDERFVLYRARDAGDNQVLLKCARAGAAPEQLSAFSADFASARRCDVPAIPRPIRIDTARAGNLYQVRQHVPGQPLSLWIDGQLPRPSLGEALQIASLLVRALEPIHARGFVHGEVYPGNVLYDFEGRGVYFVDCAWMRSHATAAASSSRSPSPYLAPEQTGTQHGQLDGRADLYAVGVILHQLATGDLPGEGVARPPRGDDRASRSLAPILAGLLARDRNQRYGNVAEVKRELARCLEEWRGQRLLPEAAPDRPDSAEAIRFPEEPFGRLSVRNALAEALRDANRGEPTLVVLTGAGGSGKSTVLADLRRSARRADALVLSGGWNPHDRELPFRGLVPVCEQLVEWLSTRARAERDRLVGELRVALGDGCAVLTEAFPVLEVVLGIHPRPVLGGMLERQNRLTYCFGSLLAALASGDRPGAAGAGRRPVGRRRQPADPGAPARSRLLAPAADSGDGADRARWGGDRVRGRARRGSPAVRPDRADAVAVTVRGSRCPQLHRPRPGRDRRAGRAAGRIAGRDVPGKPAGSARDLGLGGQPRTGAFQPGRGVLDLAAGGDPEQPASEDVAQILAQRISALPAPALAALGAAACLGATFDGPVVAGLLDRPPAEIAAALEACLTAGFLLPVREEAGTAPSRPICLSS
jgi:hypothetical protein